MRSRWFPGACPITNPSLHPEWLTFTAPYWHNFTPPLTKRLLRLQKQMLAPKLLIIDELGFVPLSKTGAELLFKLVSQRYEKSSTLITSNLPFEEWTETFGSERLTGALLDRLTHHVSILEMNGVSYRLAQSRKATKNT